MDDSDTDGEVTGNQPTVRSDIRWSLFPKVMGGQGWVKREGRIKKEKGKFWPKLEIEKETKREKCDIDVNDASFERKGTTVLFAQPSGPAINLYHIDIYFNHFLL